MNLRGPADYMSPQWLDLFSFAVSEAHRLGMELGFHNAAGWSSSGGPWVTPENAMQTVVVSETNTTGGKPQTIKLPQPATKLGYYRDIAVIAFPTPRNPQRIANWQRKTLKEQTFKSHILPDSVFVDSAAVIKTTDIVDLTDDMLPDGTLQWTPPTGQWTVLRIGHTPTGARNRPATAGGRGLECDKMSRKALELYWQGGVKPILDRVRPYVGTTLIDCIIDSYEVGCGNWTPGFDTEFKKRRGYNLAPFLPTLAGYYVASGEITERFLWDFRRTIGDLIADNYYGHFAELCHAEGLRFSSEPYGGPFESASVGGKMDIIMGEFWSGNQTFMYSPRLAASIAHTNGKTLVGAEAFTNSYGKWLSHPAYLKGVGDYAWTEGVNRLLFHTYTHQPWNVRPGLTMSRYGIDLNRMNTWWELSRAYMNYIARAQYLLQQGNNVADVLLFTGESSPNDGILRPDIKALGYMLGQSHIMASFRE
ncbi:MAG: glycosyl hydrolase [Prevotella sp.]